MAKLYLIGRLQEQCFVDVIFDTVILKASFERLPENDKLFWASPASKAPHCKRPLVKSRQNLDMAKRTTAIVH
jgi:hypothetical protein